MNLQFPIKPHQWAVFLTLGLVCCALYSFDAQLHNVLNYNATHIENGQLWRLFSGHLLHTNFNHLLLNFGGVILIWALHGDYYNYQNGSLLLILIALLTSLGLFFGSALTLYVGLSGVLHGLFTWGVIQDIKRGLKSGWLLLIGIALKVIQEQLHGASLNTALLIEADVAVDAHLYGALAGLAATLLIKSAPVQQKNQAL